MKRNSANALYLIVMVFCLLPYGINAGQNQSTPSPKGAQTYIVYPADGSTVSSPVTVVFGLRNMGVAPAGTAMENTGHHHLLVDMKQMPDLNKPLGSEVKHFGGGQTEVELTLKPGKHTLQLVLGDQNHVPHNPPVISQKITFTVK